ncbi:BQ2448_5880 [Microbotryum intermedium]|uniref:RING-type E3 ubiquitin transferase n=1 Tax=Microbotryum intermedium TaxID=269621 RepID=A0A238F5W8_9BASI|nr:BQ2448_5880 [Microbotryum intermedium]
MASSTPAPPGMSARRAAFGGQLSTPDGATTTTSASRTPPTTHGSNANTSASTRNDQAQSSPSTNPPVRAGKGKAPASSSRSKQPQSIANARASGEPSSSSKRGQNGNGNGNEQNKNDINHKTSSLEGVLSPSQAALDAAAKAAAMAQATQDEDEIICLICADTATFWAVGVCNHRTCHTCSIRLRALYKKKECTLCKTECDRVVFTSSPDRPYLDYPESVVPFSDAKLGISFETREQMDDSLALLRFNCPISTCDSICLGWADLKRHVRSSHQSNLCDLCCSNKKIFAHEHSTYVSRELNQHIQNDHNSCEFCRRAFYDSDQLYAHCRDAHEECFICVRKGIRHQYHLNYSQLEAHYKAAHFLCPHPTCLEKKFIVFETELDLQAHAVQEHGAALAGDQRSRRDARRIETNFTYEASDAEPPAGGRGGRGDVRSGRRGGRGGGSGADGGRRAETAPAAAAFVSTTDAPNRSRVVPGLGPAASLTNGSTSRANRFSSALTSESNPSSAPSSGRATPDPTTVERHAQVMRLVADAVAGSEAKVTSFKLAIHAFRANEVSADDLVDQLWNVFDQDADKAEPIVKGVAGLMEDADKRAALHAAWRDRRIEQNQFPSLTALAPTLHGVPTTTKNSSPRALNSRSTRNQRDPNIWARVEQAANRPAAIASANPFPALSSARNVVPGMAPRQPATGSGHHTPWSASASSGGVASSSSTPTATRYPSPSPTLGAMPPLPSSSYASSSTPVTRQAPPSAARRTTSGMEFPSLPVSTTEIDRRARIRAAMGKPSQTILDGSPSNERSASPWGPSNSRDEQEFNASVEAESNGGAAQGADKKKKKKTKVLLMSHGMHHA